MPELIHGCAAALKVPGSGWCGVLLTGPSGSGKSDLLLRLRAAGWRAVADDYVHAWTSGGRVYARSPDTIAGRMEVRGLGVHRMPALTFTRIDLVARCVDARPERMPESDLEVVDGLRVPLVRLQPLNASAPTWLAEALMGLGAGRPLSY